MLHPLLSVILFASLMLMIILSHSVDTSPPAKIAALPFHIYFHPISSGVRFHTVIVTKKSQFVVSAALIEL